MTEFLSKSLEETKNIAFDFANSLEDAHQGEVTVVGLYGDLGSGKTTFMKYFAEALGVKETIQSPTFIIMRIFNLEFSIFKKLIHIDAYRLDSSDELLKLGWQELISDPDNLICVEWPDRLADIMSGHLKIKFEHVSENERNILINKIQGPHSLAKVRATIP